MRALGPLERELKMAVCHCGLLGIEPVSSGTCLIAESSLQPQHHTFTFGLSYMYHGAYTSFGARSF